MYWGAADEARADADDPKRRVRRFGAATAMVVLAIGGSVAMASASTSHANAAAIPAASDTSPPTFAPKPVVTTTSTTAPSPLPTTPPTTAPHAAPTTLAHPAAAPVHQAVVTANQTRSTTPAAPALAGADTCGAALAYLGAHSAPGFQYECPGYALGHQAMTCIDVAGVCPGAKLIVISDVCPASYMNEAHNSWVLSGLSSGSIDPYGYCH
jgi:hypothetical protein